MNRGKVVALVICIIIISLIAWVYQQSTKSVVGQKLEDLGRDHVDVGTEVKFNSNPPTSGKHYADWTRSGIYKNPQDDRNLIHSLEHGYVIISYNCERKIGRIFNLMVGQVLAHEIDFTEVREASASANLPDSFNSDNCHALVDKLVSVYEANKLSSSNKLIIVPRPDLDSEIALTAWTYLDKFAGFDWQRIDGFIDTHRGFGPERTME